MKIEIFGKTHCPYCDKALEFLRDTDHTIGVLQADKRFDKFPNDIGWKPDVVFSFKNYMILPKKITDSTLCINFHPGPPEHPGSCSANWALYNHDSEFGVTAHFMNDLVDNNFWFDCWQNNKLGFNQETPNATLVKFFTTFSIPSNNASPIIK